VKSFNLKLPEDKVVDLVSKNRDTLKRCIYNLDTQSCFVAAQASINRLLDIYTEKHSAWAEREINFTFDSESHSVVLNRSKFKKELIEATLSDLRRIRSELDEICL
jgi:hypothetical protein